MMLQINANKKAYSVLSPISSSAISFPVAENSVYQNLAKLSNKKQWVLFTANCPRPTQHELTRHNVSCDKVIHMKPSIQFSEEQIVVKAIQARTASAIVASSDLQQDAKNRIQRIASNYSCEVFFLSQPTASSLSTAQLH
ncbi:cell division inhibitor SulA [Vibrio sp. MACH09]|uniref:hypothetical protein n=1 Tax=unclassified Vibrio TaxID=2614977 RepID=UPI0014935F52|nr:MULTISPECIES: hypothetical protein [unclassified Vibrio]NOI68093.1 hypothetical protein [Vibrio sp. 99-8-1]GLO60832.1 cell division inhibitor SulA [Vibrio sp. MACH09]